MSITVNALVNGETRKIDVLQFCIESGSWIRTFERMVDLGVTEIDFNMELNASMPWENHFLMVEAAQSIMPGIDSVRVLGKVIPLLWLADTPETVFVEDLQCA